MVNPTGTPDCAAATWANGQRVVTVNPLQSIHGHFTYNNPANTSLVTTSPKSIEVKLYENNVQHGSTINTTDGSYTFTDLCPGTYQLRVSSDLSTVGSVNGTDAAQTNYFAGHPTAYGSGSIEKVRFHAGDVGNSTTPGDLTINSSDALNILQHFVNNQAFNTDWTFWTKNQFIASASTSEYYPSVTLTAGNSGETSLDMYGLCTGDFNLSFTPGSSKASSETLDLLNDGEQLVAANQQINLAVRIADAALLGATSLVLNFPADMVEIEDVVMLANSGDLQWAVNGNEVRIGWFSQVAFNLNAMDQVLVLKLKTKAGFVNGAEINFTLAANPLNEVANANFEVISHASLVIAKLKASSLQIQNAAAAFSLSNYPNPFNGHTVISYTLPSDAAVSLNVYNYLGSCVQQLLNANQLKGAHSLDLDASGLAAGIYTARITVKTADGEIVKTIKIVNNK